MPYLRHSVCIRDAFHVSSWHHRVTLNDSKAVSPSRSRFSLSTVIQTLVLPAESASVKSKKIYKLDKKSI